MDVGLQAAETVTAPAQSAPVMPSHEPYVDPGVQAQKAPTVPAGPGPRAVTESFTTAMANVFGGSSGPRNVEVNLRVAEHPNEIIAVFRDAATGEVINQVPPETIVRLAEFFQQEAAGTLVDRDA